jgi:hypothetical protein
MPTEKTHPHVAENLQPGKSPENNGNTVFSDQKDPHADYRAGHPLPAAMLSPRSHPVTNRLEPLARLSVLPRLARELMWRDSGNTQPPGLFNRS